MKVLTLTFFFTYWVTFGSSREIHVVTIGSFVIVLGYDLEPYRKKLCAFDKDRKPEDKNGNSSYERAQINQSIKPEVSTLGRHSNHPRQSIRSLTHLEHKKPHAKRAAWNIFRSKKNEKT